MDIGIFAKTFVRPTLPAVLDTVVEHGLYCVQFNLACAGLPSLPEHIDNADTMRRALAQRGIAMAAISGTFNMIHPDPARRRDGMNRLRTLAAACGRLGTSVITLCTGTRDPDNMWRRHPDNDSTQAWRDLVAAMIEALDIAEEHNLTLAFEPEVSNVIDSAQKGRLLLDEIGSPRLKVVMDGANLFHTGELPRMRQILDEAFDLLGDDIVLAHAKDLSRDGEAGHDAAGTGVLDYDHYLALLRRVGFNGPLILHGLAEEQVDPAVAFLRSKLESEPRRFFQRDGVNFHYLDRGAGTPFVFQHGLGGDVNQPAGLFRPPPGVRFISLDCRAHGRTRPLGDPDQIGFVPFADDVAALLDHLGIERAVVGGISMGAGVALNFALRYPRRVLGLVLSRPAWLDQPLPEPTRVYLQMAALIRQHGTVVGLAKFLQTHEPAESLVGQFQHPRAEETVVKLERIPRDVPNRDRRQWATITVPTLVLANRQDDIHPYEYGRTLAGAITGASFAELTPKIVSKDRHAADAQKFLEQFFRERILPC